MSRRPADDSPLEQPLGQPAKKDAVLIANQLSTMVKDAERAAAQEAEPVGMFKNLSPDDLFVKDPKAAGRTNSTMGNQIPAPIGVRYPKNISKEAKLMATTSQLQYKVPHVARDFAFEAARDKYTNASRGRS